MLGEIKEISNRGSFPISCLTARTFARNRIALVGEAAHTLPPIGAQGLNLGVRDCAHLASCLKTSANGSADPGRLSVLNDYNKSRKFDVWSRTAGTDILNKSLLSTFLPFKAMRYTGLHLLNHLSPLRKLVMQEGIGAARKPGPIACGSCKSTRMKSAGNYGSV